MSDGLDYLKVGDTEIPSRAYVASFGFKGSDQQKPAGVLSGGERNRLNLALTLKQGGNLLLLDEPTNDLDVETLSSLEEAPHGLPRLLGRHQPRPHGSSTALPRTSSAWEGTDENPGRLVLVRRQLRQRTRRTASSDWAEEAAKPHRIHRKLTRD